MSIAEKKNVTELVLKTSMIDRTAEKKAFVLRVRSPLRRGLIALRDSKR